jgi:protein gp37
MSTKIEWCTETWNPIVGCTKISPGCDNCYAEKMATRLAGMAIKNVVPDTIGKYVKVIKGRKWDGTVAFDEITLTKPLKWKKPRLIFVCSMGDLFHENVKENWIDQVIDVIEHCPQHTFIILTKRPVSMKEYFQDNHFYGWEIPKNIWLGVTAENQMRANERIPILLSIPAAKRFVSVEPMLTKINLINVYQTQDQNEHKQLGYIDWVICGGESGPGARPIDPEWVRFIQVQCKVAEIPFFFKGWGGKRNNKAGSLLDAKEYKQYPKS